MNRGCSFISVYALWYFLLLSYIYIHKPQLKSLQLRNPDLPAKYLEMYYAALVLCIVGISDLRMANRNRKEV